MPEIVQSGARRVLLDEIRERSARVATGLALLGVSDGGGVAVMLRNDLSFLEVMIATERIGAYCVPLNWHDKSDDVNYILRDSGATVLVIHADLLGGIRDGIPEGVTILCVATPAEIVTAYGIAPALATPPDGCLEWESWLAQHAPWRQRSRPSRGRMIYTSGTTGRPKGVRRRPVRDEDRKTFADLSDQWFGFRPGVRTAIIGPLYHSVQATYAAAALRVPDCSVFLLPRFEAEQVLRLVDEERLTHLHLVPIMMSRLVRLPDEVRGRYDVSSLEFVVHGAAPCPPEIKRRLIEWWGPKIHEYYGTTEGGMVSRSSSVEWLERPGTVGRAWRGRVLRICDAAGLALSPHVEGEVCFSLGSVPDFTYHGAEEKRAEIERDGLITNGDIGYLDEAGYLFLCDRKRDMVISGGVNIYPAEIEAVLATHPDVADSAVFGVPDEEFGEALAAVVQPRSGATLSSDELREFLGARMADFKVPRSFEMCDSLPREDSGKIFKRRLREPYWARTGRRI